MTIDESLAEARENVARNHSTEPCVVSRLILEHDREEAVSELPALMAARELIRSLADCYFLRRSEGLLELMLRADRMSPPTPETTQPTTTKPNP